MAADLIQTITAAVQGCDDVGCSTTYVGSDNSIVPENRLPTSPTSLAPPNGSQTSTTPILSSTFSDPDSDQSGYVAYRVYRAADNALVASGNGATVVSGHSSAWTTTPALSYGQEYYYTAQATDALGAVSSVVGSAGSSAFFVPPSVPALDIPASDSQLQTVTPVLSASSTSAEPISYEFQVATDSAFSNIVADSSSSGVPVAASSWAVPAGFLQDGQTYYWRAQATDEDGATSAWASPQSFSIHLQHLGVRDYWPTWSHGPLTVNEANGNLVLSLPTPSYPTAVGSLGFSLTYNSQLATSSPSALGAGWTLVAGDGSMSPPVQLVDDTSTLQEAVVDWPDGSSDYYNEVGSTDTYLPPVADGSQLTRQVSGGTTTWTLFSGDGTTYTFEAEGEGGVFAVSSAQSAATANGSGLLTYTYASGEITALTFQQTSRSAPETLAFNWSCSGAILCVKSPDLSQTWRYTADDGAHPDEITGVYDSVGRKILGISYASSSDLISEVQNADDLNPPAGYDGTHSIQLTYASNKVSCVLDGPITGQGSVSIPSSCGIGTSSVHDSIWSFNYSPTCPSLQGPASTTHAVAQGSAVGCTTRTNPDQQQAGGGGITVLYDNLDRPLEIDDTRLGTGSNERISLVQYNNQNQLAWSEDADGNPTDYSYDPVNNVLLSVSGPPPAAGQPRPVTTYRYDEQTVGSVRQAANPLTGLAGTYWSGQYLTGAPAAHEADPAANSGATVFSLAGGWPVSGDSSARWTGDLIVPSTGYYYFSTVSDGGTRLLIDQQDLIENWTIPSSPPQTVTTPRPTYLTAGDHPIVVEYEHAASASPSLALEWSCGHCDPAIPGEDIPVGNLAPAYENQTSVVSPAGRISFQHFLQPWTGEPDYSLTPGGSFPTIAANGGQGGGGADGCTAGGGGSGGAASTGSDVGASYAGGSGGVGATYCGNDDPEGGAGGSSAGTASSGASGEDGGLYLNNALGGSAPTGGGNGGDTGWGLNGSGPTGMPGSAPGGGGGASGATQCCDGYNAGAGGDGQVVVTPNIGSATTYSSAGTYVYTVPSGVSSVVAELWGAGGGGGRGYSSGSAGGAGGGGGGGGAYVKTTSLPVTAGETLNVTVGAGGAVGATTPPGSGQPAGAGAAGGASSIADSTPPAITSYLYDSLGRLYTKYMPKANASATIDPTTGDLSGTPDSNYRTDYRYYDDGAGETIPPDCPDGGGMVANEYGQLKSTTQYTNAVPGGIQPVVTVYNTLGLPIAVTNGKGVSCLTYDVNGQGQSEGRLLTETPHGDQSAADTINYTYDPNGTVTKTQQGASGPTVTDTYDEAGRLVDTVDASGAEASYAYDGDGNITQRDTATGQLSLSTNYDTSYSYWANDELKTETDPAGNTYSFYYDDNGNLRGTQYPITTHDLTGTFSWVDTNPDGLVTDYYNRHGSIGPTTTPSTVPSDSNPLADFTYTYDADGKRLSQVRTSGSTSDTTAYNYDSVGRLSQVLLPSDTCRDYSYDLDSNRVGVSESPTGCSGTFTTTASYSYTPATTPGIDQLTSVTQGGNETDYSYTSDGQVSGQGSTTYTWDGFGRLSTATVGSNTITYTYDPTGALMSRSSSSPASTINYVLGDLFETDANHTITTSYADGPSGDLASFNGPPTSSSTASFLYYDAHGDLAAEADNTGALTASHTYDPFGAPLDSVPTNSTTHRFVGRWDKQYDTATSLILMGARPYDPNTGRFLAVDPIPGGSLNNYDYAGQDPINNYDLTGDMYCGPGPRCSPGDFNFWHWVWQNRSMLVHEAAAKAYSQLERAWDYTERQLKAKPGEDPWAPLKKIWHGIEFGGHVVMCARSILQGAPTSCNQF